MDVKLIKVEDEFYNLVGKEDLELIASDDEVFQHNYKTAKLSLKNCQAIERGYDLDELFESVPRNLTYEDDKWKLRAGFITGFQKALEILGDKKFSEEQMFKMFIYGHALTNAIKLKVVEDKPMGDIFNDFIQSLQQTEWEVEIEMECVMGCQNFLLNGEKSVCCGDKKPKLDADGCLILKRI